MERISEEVRAKYAKKKNNRGRGVEEGQGDGGDRENLGTMSENLSMMIKQSRVERIERISERKPNKIASQPLANPKEAVKGLK